MKEIKKFCDKCRRFISIKRESYKEKPVLLRRRRRSSSDIFIGSYWLLLCSKCRSEIVDIVKSFDNEMKDLENREHEVDKRKDNLLRNWLRKKR